MADVEKTVENLKKRGYTVSRFAGKAEAADYLVGAVGDRAVGIGGSMTIRELGLYPRLRSRGETYWHWEKDDEDATRKANAAPVYLMSANGVSESGRIVNIDGAGNRVQQMCYGHEKVFIVIGTNKIAPNDEMALWRARNIAGPKNAARVKVNTPCVKGEPQCYDCNSEDRICSVFVTVDRRPWGIGEVEVVIVDEALGY